MSEPSRENGLKLKPRGYHTATTRNSGQTQKVVSVRFPVRGHQCFVTEYTVIPEDYTPLLGSESVLQFCLITVNKDNIMSLKHTASMQPDLVSRFHDIFSGEGKLEGKLHLEIDQSVPSVAL